MSDHEFPHIGPKKHVFIDYSMVEPGHGVSLGDALRTSWEMPYGVKIVAHKPRIDPEPMVAVEKPWETTFTKHTTLFEDEGASTVCITPSLAVSTSPPVRNPRASCSCTQNRPMARTG